MYVPFELASGTGVGELHPWEAGLLPHLTTRKPVDFDHLVEHVSARIATADETRLLELSKRDAVLTMLLTICDPGGTALVAIDMVLPASRHELEDIVPLRCAAVKGEVMAGFGSIADEFRINEFGDRESRAFAVKPEDIEGTTVRGWLLLTAETAHPLVMLEAEDRDSRNRRALLPDLARGMVEILTELGGLRVADASPQIMGRDHPGWCTQEEGAGEPHRSRELTAGLPQNDSTVLARLVRGQHHPTESPATFIDLKDWDRALEWPPITSDQHDVLIREMTALLGQQRHLATC